MKTEKCRKCHDEFPIDRMLFIDSKGHSCKNPICQDCHERSVRMPDDDYQPVHRRGREAIIAQLQYDGSYRER